MILYNKSINKWNRKMLAVASENIQSIYENQPLLTQSGGFPPPGSADALDELEEEEEDGS